MYHDVHGLDECVTGQIGGWEAVDAPTNIQRHAFKNTPEEVGHCFCSVWFCFVLSGTLSLNAILIRGSMSNTPSGIGERPEDGNEGPILEGHGPPERFGGFPSCFHICGHHELEGGNQVCRFMSSVFFGRCNDCNRHMVSFKNSTADG